MLYVSIAIASTRNAASASGRVQHGRNAVLRATPPVGEESLWAPVEPGQYWLAYVPTSAARMGQTQWAGYAHPGRCGHATGFPQGTQAVDATDATTEILEHCW